MGDHIAEVTRTVYQKDLHSRYFNLNLRLGSEELEHGDTLRVTVEKMEEAPNRDTEPENEETLQEE